jgi:phage baseplate assembly protein W
MEYVIDTSNPVTLNWNATNNERIVQNVLNLISTWKYEVAYNRDMGINSELLDKPLEIASAQYLSEVIRVIQDYEPRATVNELKFTGVDVDGNMQFKVVIEV